jgi:hypothetical protein
MHHEVRWRGRKPDFLHRLILIGATEGRVPLDKIISGLITNNMALSGQRDTHFDVQAETAA